jgi:hypothetical protein
MHSRELEKFKAFGQNTNHLVLALRRDAVDRPGIPGFPYSLFSKPAGQLILAPGG